MWIIQRIATKIVHLPQQLVLGLITLYQRTLSPDHGWFRARYPYGYCKFTPSCSQYGYQAVAKYGVLLGGFKIGWRIVRCNPWSKGGVDPVK